MKKKIKKSEIKNILNRGWDARRELSKVRSGKNSEASKKWQAREKYENELHTETVRRFKHYLSSNKTKISNDPLRNM